ncbi:MAG: hypothetical protein IJ640_10785 [Prevotella sp.]|nr:hypothetical protein [Prevotella sp.]
MKKINFSKIDVQVSFDGSRQTFDVSKTLGNAMMYNGSVLSDIGFEELARKIYFSDTEVEVPDEYVRPLLQVIMESNFVVAIKRHFRNLLNGQ